MGIVLNDKSGLANNCLLDEILPSITFYLFSNISTSLLYSSTFFLILYNIYKKMIVDMDVDTQSNPSLVSIYSLSPL